VTDFEIERASGPDGPQLHEPVSPELRALRDDPDLGPILAESTGFPRELFHRAAELARDGRVDAAARLARASLTEVDHTMLGDELDLLCIVVVTCALVAEGDWERAGALYHPARRLQEALYLRAGQAHIEGDRRVTSGILAMREHVPDALLRACARALVEDHWAPVHDVILEQIPGADDRQLAAFAFSEHAPLLFHRVAQVWPHVPRPRRADSPWWVWVGAAVLGLITVIVLFMAMPLVLPSTWIRRAPTVPDIDPGGDALSQAAHQLCPPEGPSGVFGWRCARVASVQTLVRAHRCEEARQELQDLGTIRVERYNGGSVTIMQRGGGHAGEPHQADDVLYRWARREVEGCRPR